MRTLVVGIALALVAVGCTDAAKPLSPKEQLVRDARELLPHDELVEAIPEGFELDRIVVNDDEYHRKGWVTVGVRLQQGPVRYARAIFYVLPDADAARAMFGHGREMAEIPGADLPAPFEVGIGVENVCNPHTDGLFWCHAVKGRLYLVTQSTLGTWPPPAKVRPEEIAAARSMITSFGSYLQGL